MIVVDTNVVSELMRTDPDERVLAWSRTLKADQAAITTITVQEVEFGLRRLPTGQRRRRLTQRWRELMEAFEEQVLDYDVPSAISTAELLHGRERLGRPMGLADAQIAGICVAGRHDLATRNMDDFDDIEGLTVVNPFAWGA